jgi:hypothetical protein
MNNIRLVYHTFEPLFFTLPVNSMLRSPTTNRMAFLGLGQEADAFMIFSRYADDSQPAASGSVSLL